MGARATCLAVCLALVGAAPALAQYAPPTGDPGPELQPPEQEDEKPPPVKEPPKPQRRTEQDDSFTWLDALEVLERAELAPPGPFVSFLADAGFAYFAPRLSVGYGVPYDRWFGMSFDGRVSRTNLQAFGGFHAELAGVQMRFSTGYVMPFERPYLRPRNSYDWREAELEEESLGTYGFAEGWTQIKRPIAGGVFIWRGSIIGLFGVPDNVYVYEHRVRVITEPPWILRGRIGWGPNLGRRGLAYVAPVLEVISLPFRDMITVRAGLEIRAQLWPAFEIRANLVPPVYSRDRLGLVTGDFTELGVRWRWSHTWLRPGAPKTRDEGNTNVPGRD